jgi:hypothetical protein
MDTPTIATLLVGGLLVLGFVLWMGFRIPARVISVDIQSGADVERDPMPEGLPAALERWLRLCYGDTLPRPLTVTAWGNGKVISARLPVLGALWTSMNWRLYLEPGAHFMWRMRAYWFRQLMVSGGEEYRDSVGRFAMNTSRVENPNLNPSMRSLLWLFTLVFAPGSVLNDERVSCEGVDEHTVKLSITVEEGADTQSFSLHFDPRDGRLVSIETVRATSRDGSLLPFFFLLEGEKKLADGVNVSLKVTAAWDDGAYGGYSVTGLCYNPSLAEPFEQGITE